MTTPDCAGGPGVTRPPDLPADLLSELPHNDAGPVFAAPWQAHAFAMTVALHAQGVFTWAEWADRLAAAIRAAQADGDADRGDTYYDHWLRALETLVAEKDIVGAAELADRRDAWDRAARATPHGAPIVLGHRG